MSAIFADPLGSEPWLGAGAGGKGDVVGCTYAFAFRSAFGSELAVSTGLFSFGQVSGLLGTRRQLDAGACLPTGGVPYQSRVHFGCPKAGLLVLQTATTRGSIRDKTESRAVR